MRKYYEANPRWLENKHLLPLHEALHIAAVEFLGRTWSKMKLNKRTGDVDIYLPISSKNWKDLAIEMAPALIDDITKGEEEYLLRANPRIRGYAWGWLNKNKEALLVRANEIAAATNGPGTLYNKNGKLVWKSKTL